MNIAIQNEEIVFSHTDSVNDPGWKPLTGAADRSNVVLKPASEEKKPDFDLLVILILIMIAEIVISQNIYKVEKEAVGIIEGYLTCMRSLHESPFDLMITLEHLLMDIMNFKQLKKKLEIVRLIEMLISLRNFLEDLLLALKEAIVEAKRRIAQADVEAGSAFQKSGQAKESNDFSLFVDNINNKAV